MISRKRQVESAKANVEAMRVNGWTDKKIQSYAATQIAATEGDIAKLKIKLKMAETRKRGWEVTRAAVAGKDLV